MSKKVALIIAGEGFQTTEYNEPKNILEQNGIQVITVSDLPQAVSNVGETTKVDILLNDFHVSGYDGVFFVGGGGAMEHLDNTESYRIAREALDSGNPYGAICISPRILASADVLKGKKVTGSNRDSELEDILINAGATYEKNSVVVDGQLITADGPGSAGMFGEAILSLLK